MKYESYLTRTDRNWFHPVMYYIAVFDCEDDVEKVLGSNLYSSLKLELEMLANEDHFSYEKQGTILINLILLMIFIVLIVNNFRSFNKFWTLYDTSDSPLIYCLAALGLQFLGIVFTLIHEFRYRANGRGYFALDVLSTILDQLSECVMTLLVMMLANGWMTRFQKYDGDNDLYIALGFFSLFLHVLMGTLTYVDQDAHHKYHDFHGW